MKLIEKIAAGEARLLRMVKREAKRFGERGMNLEDAVRRKAAQLSTKRVVSKGPLAASKATKKTMEQAGQNIGSRIMNVPERSQFISKGVEYQRQVRKGGRKLIGPPKRSSTLTRIK